MRFDSQTPPKGTVRDWINHRADITPDEVSHFFPDKGTTLTWGELRDSARDVAYRLTALGIDKGESVAICKPNGRNAIICLFGIFYGGFRATPLDLSVEASQLGHSINHCKCRYIFLGKSQVGLFGAALSEVDAHPCTIPVDTHIMFPGAGKLQDVALHDITADDHALLMYTSGTTGVPKGVVHTHASLLAGGWATSIAHDLTSEDRAFCVLPYYNINGLCVTLIAPLISGGQVAMAIKFSASKFWQHCEDYEATWFSAVPTILSHLLHSDRVPNEMCKNRMRFGRSACAPLAPEVQTSFEEKFGVTIIETMGLTEAAASILASPLPPKQRKLGSSGIACGNEIAIFNHKQEPVKTGMTGELVVRGPNILKEYLDNPEATKAVLIHDGWFRTGDMGYQDEDGYVFVTGRLKELIIKGGENIAPREIDDVLYSHKEVIEAAVFASQCETHGQRIDAAVVTPVGSTVSGAELIELCKSKLGPYKCPDNIHFVKELPKGASGQIQRLKLKELFSE
ncbi:AMP-binding protein [Amylibacter sp. SFDW26]|uniref:AMP-binding protein n=1 Tax=Amylibacter sp. SFDW26 TaxID=2652722 RepID=UPI001261B810|nr:AMP-binding protein [Amylibacter sp. SFDW26]KAB7613793.1 AMP-binding protein [Amylibacter sp. SFDW26]